MTVPAGEKCPSCGSIMKQSPGTQPGVTIWTCVRCKTEKAKTVVYDREATDEERASQLQSV